ncbi:MAG TPA: hypothetical protein VLS51_09370, partial [Propionibacteriaceae bacterium]|nr:hypothetical protein [Propionibacteriaceae bacterium]
APEEPVGPDETEALQAQAEQESASTEADVTWGSWQAAPAMGAEPETVTEMVAAMGVEHEADEEQVPAAEAEPGETLAPEAEAEETQAEAEEPEAEPLVAPDDAQDLDLVDWEPSPVTTLPTESTDEAAPAEEPEEAAEEPITPEASEPVTPEASEPVTEAPEEAEPDHSVGLTGAAAAALAAASAWGVWSGAPAVPSMPAPSPFPVAEPEPEPAMSAEATEGEAIEQPSETGEPEPTDEVQPEPTEDTEPFGLYVPEPEVLTIPEPQPSADEPEHPAFSAGLVTTPIPEPDMYAAPGRPPFQVPEPEPYVIPEPLASSEPVFFTPPTGDTTPIPEPGFPPYVEPTVVETPQDVQASPFAAHERVHEAAGASAAYDLRVDVFSVLGFPAPVAAPDTAGDTTTADTTAENPAPAPDLVDAPAEDPEADESVDPAPEPDGEAEHEESEHPRWFDRAKMWAANNLYDPDEETPAAAEEAHPQDEQNR